MKQQIVALGGGGFSIDPSNIALDRYILSLTGKDHPKVLFLPQASSENEKYILYFYKALTSLGAIPSWLSLFGSLQQSDFDQILEQDVIYVGGGNTRSMLALWREWGVDKLLKQALENGTILAGVSAGAICWFEECVTDSVHPLGIMNGLGFLQGSACPHYDGEADRRPALHSFIAQDALLPCIALCDHAAAHYVDGSLHQVVTNHPTAKAFHVSKQAGVVIEDELSAMYLGTEE